MNDGKSFEEAQATGTGNPQTHSSGLDSADMKRRRLIRGAAGMAPVMLTLRSGSLLAAASGCATVVSYGEINTAGTGEYVQTAAGSGIPAATNICVENASQGLCPTGQIQSGTHTTTLSGSPLKCLDGSSNPLANGTQVAIVSASAALSILP